MNTQFRATAEEVTVVTTNTAEETLEITMATMEELPDGPAKDMLKEQIIKIQARLLQKATASADQDTEEKATAEAIEALLGPPVNLEGGGEEDPLSPMSMVSNDSEGWGLEAQELGLQEGDSDLTDWLPPLPGGPGHAGGGNSGPHSWPALSHTPRDTARK